MSIDVIIGGQGGDESKGNTAAYLSLYGDYSVCLRVSAPQAGHSIYINGKKIGLAQLPTGVINPHMRVLMGAGSLISVEKVLREIRETGANPENVGIDYRATIVSPEHLAKEKEDEYLMKSIGSVGTGVSACRIDKIMRRIDLKFAKDIPELEPYLTDTKRELIHVLENSSNILLEGDHGAKLDLIHGEYPKVTTRAVNAAGFLSEAGIGPKYVREVYVILKPYTTRVGPGPLENEIFNKAHLKWGFESGGELGSVSKRKRRMGEFEWKQVSNVIKQNSATKLVFSHMDWFNSDEAKREERTAEKFLAEVNERLCSNFPYPKIALLSYGPNTEDVKPFGN